MNRIKNKKGFTLIELIIVIAILGIILLIGVPKFTDILRDARINADIATASSLGKAVRLWSIKNEQATPIRYIPTTVTEFNVENVTDDPDVVDDVFPLLGLDNYFSPTTKPPASFGEGGAYYIVENNYKIAVGIDKSGGVTAGGALDTLPKVQDDVKYGEDLPNGTPIAGWAYLEQ